MQATNAAHTRFSHKQNTHLYLLPLTRRNNSFLQGFTTFENQRRRIRDEAIEEQVSSLITFHQKTSSIGDKTGWSQIGSFLEVRES